LHGAGGLVAAAPIPCSMHLPVSLHLHSEMHELAVGLF